LRKLCSKGDPEMVIVQKLNTQQVDLSQAPWAMHEFFTGSGLVAYGLQGMFSPIYQRGLDRGGT
jgi:hypothetical protein